MRHTLSIFCILFFMLASNAQDDGRRLLRGKVLDHGNNVPNENVINTSTEKATITNASGEYAILVKEGDELVFSALNYQLQRIIITPEILQKNRLIIEVEEKVTKLDEVVISPEEQKKFLEMENEKFKKYEYEIDRTTEVENTAISQSDKGLQDGLNFVSIFNALTGSKKKEKTEEKPKLRMSEVLRQVYEDRFFVSDLNIPQDKIEAFLTYCDAQMPAQSLLKKTNEFQLIDFLVNHSKTFLEDIDE